MRNFSYKLVKKHKNRMSFVVLISFLFTFVFVRIYVILGTIGIIDDPYLYIKGYHIHHLNYGIIILSISGFLALIFQNAKNRIKIGVLYGIGLGLTFDEFGMWLKLEDDYWMRASYDAVITITLLLASIIYFPSFWNKTLNHANNITKKATGIKEKINSKKPKF